MQRASVKRDPPSPLIKEWRDKAESQRSLLAIPKRFLFLPTPLIEARVEASVAYVRASTIKGRMPLLTALIHDQGSESDAMSLVRSVAIQNLDHKEPLKRTTLDLISYLRKSRRRDLAAHAQQREDGMDLTTSPSRTNSALQEAERQQMIDRLCTGNPKVAQAIAHWYGGDTFIIAAKKAGIGVSTLRKHIAAIAKTLKPLS